VKFPTCISKSIFNRFRKEMAIILLEQIRYMSEGHHRCKVLGLTPTDQIINDTEKRGNRSKKLKRKFTGTDNKIKDIMSTITYRTKLML
jgi:prophage antirepressor-like protein